MKRVWSAIALFAISCVLLLTARHLPNFANTYGKRIYPFWVNTLGRISNIVSFSVVEILLYVIVVIIIVWFIRFLWKTYHNGGEGQAFFICGMKNAALFISILFMLYTLTCGINYYRTSFAEYYNIEKERYNEKDLIAVSKVLKDNVNELAGRIKRDSEGVMELTKGTEERAVHAMNQLGDTYARLKGYYPRPKRLLNAWILSVQNLTGVYSPFTVEANYNTAMVDYNEPFTACHELSHLRGFMQEDEANFIAYLACEQSDDLEFQYSGALMAWLYCGNELYRYNKEAYRAIEIELDARAKADLQANNEFWDNYEGIVANTTEKINDAYLKAHGQEHGVDSYNRVVDLLVQYLSDSLNEA